MKYRAVLILALSLGLTSIAHARSQRIQQIPNGANVYCSGCHVSEFPQGPQDADHNAFGEQVELNLTGGGAAATQEVDWQAIYNLDADGDGYTNGEELGDPDGEWAQGEDVPRSYDYSFPGDASSHQCDNPDLAKTSACPGENGGGADTGGDEGTDAGPGTDTTGTDPSTDTGTDSGTGTDTGAPGNIDASGSGDGGCSATGAGEPVSPAAMILLIGLGLAAVRRQFLN